MELLPYDIQTYAEQHSTSESELLHEINRQTHAQVLMPRMLSGHLQGRLLAMISRMVRPVYILEIGTYTGYSALCLAEGLVATPEAKLYTIDINEELEPRVRSYFEKAGLTQTIEYLIGDAVEIIPTLQKPWDLVFIDADKANYSLYFDLVIDSVRPGGFIIADNVLWSGKVIDPHPDKATQHLLDFNTKVHNDPRVSNVLLPVRDGLMLMQKN